MKKERNYSIVIGASSALLLMWCVERLLVH